MEDRNQKRRITRKSRRSFFGSLGKLSGGTVLSQVLIPETSFRPGGNLRQRTAYDLRLKAAQKQRQRPPASGITNGDEARYPSLIANFTKGFLHTQLGEIDPRPGSYPALLQALSTQQHADFEKIPIGYVRKMVNPQAAFAYDLVGADSHTIDMVPPPAFASAAAAADLVELYWQALTRDIPFADWDTSPLIQSAAAEFSKLSGYTGPKDAAGKVTPANIFRANLPGCLVGPYLSQYLLKTIHFGSTPREQMYRTGVVGIDYLSSYEEWLQLQDGLGPYREERFDPTYRYIRSGRDLAQFVHYDYTYQVFLQAALIIMDQYPETLLNFNLYQLSATSPYKSSRVQTGFITFGSSQVLDLLARASNIALQATWWHKWSLHRRLRPEEFAGKVYNTLSGLSQYPIHSDLLNSKAVQTTIQQTGLSLLPQAYVEGAPLHPSYPAGHATIAGACTTILKAFFNEGALISGAVQPSRDGLSLLSADGLGLTLGGELNKLAFNVPMGRNWAGIHYRSDAWEGLKLGEQVAICILEDHVGSMTESFAGFQFTKFDGTPVQITAG